VGIEVARTDAPATDEFTARLAMAHRETELGTHLTVGPGFGTKSRFFAAVHECPRRRPSGSWRSALVRTRVRARRRTFPRSRIRTAPSTSFSK
jgi:hypothetical protein